MDIIENILDRVTALLRKVTGVHSVMLGGSRAGETYRPDSDVDIGIYYDAKELDLIELEATARELDDLHRENLIVPPGGWGQWVNGGGWLKINGWAVDLILRDIDCVKKAVDDCEEGIVTAHYQIGHPHAYLNVMYRGELATGRLLWDKTGETVWMRQNAERYPAKLKEALISFFGFEAEFSATLAEKNVEHNDVFYVMAHLVRAVSALNQVLFALHEQYCINEKNAINIISSFKNVPQNYQQKIKSVFDMGCSRPAEACKLLRQIVVEVKALTEQ